MVLVSHRRGVQNAIVDWGWRAMHLSVLAGKEVVKQYYETAANKSYYLGCSNGRSLFIDFVYFRSSSLTCVPAIRLHCHAGGRQGYVVTWAPNGLMLILHGGVSPQT